MTDAQKPAAGQANQVNQNKRKAQESSEEESSEEEESEEEEVRAEGACKLLRQA